MTAEAEVKKIGAATKDFHKILSRSGLGGLLIVFGKEAGGVNMTLPTWFVGHACQEHLVHLDKEAGIEDLQQAVGSLIALHKQVIEADRLLGETLSEIEGLLLGRLNPEMN